MPLFRKVLYAVDFSPLSEIALRYAVKLKEAGEEEVVLVHVVDALTVQLPESVDFLKEKEILDALPDGDRDRITGALSRLADLKRFLEEEGLRSSIRLRYGDIVDQIISVAEEEGADVILMGAHGKGFLSEILVGSVSAGVLRRAGCPVLLVKEGWQDGL